MKGAMSSGLDDMFTGRQVHTVGRRSLVESALQVLLAPCIHADTLQGWSITSAASMAAPLTASSMSWHLLQRARMAISHVCKGVRGLH